jgi:hypothetical protein
MGIVQPLVWAELRGGNMHHPNYEQGLDEQYFEAIFLIVLTPRMVNGRLRALSRGMVQKGDPLCFLRRNQYISRP